MSTINALPTLPVERSSSAPERDDRQLDSRLQNSGVAVWLARFAWSLGLLSTVLLRSCASSEQLD